MSHLRRLKYCHSCIKMGCDTTGAAICLLTNHTPSFDGTCPSFVPKAECAEIYKPEANMWKRLLNFTFDFIFIGIIYVIFGMATGIFFMLFSPSTLPAIQQVGELGGDYLLFIGISVIYFSVEAYTGKSCAKFITSTKVITLGGKNPGFMLVLARTLCKFIPLNIISFLWGGNWHDRFTRTKVINDNTL